MPQKQATELIFHLLPLLERKLIRPFKEQYRPELSPLQMHVLSFLCKAEAPMHAIAKELFVSKQQLTPVIDKLVQKGLVQRKPNPLDRRMITISLSAAGKAYWQETKISITQMLEERLHLLPEEEVRQLISSTQQLEAILQKLP